jgi:hypothetical protein
MSSEQLTSVINGYHDACDNNNSTEASQRYNNMRDIPEGMIEVEDAHSFNFFPC